MGGRSSRSSPPPTQQPTPSPSVQEKTPSPPVQETTPSPPVQETTPSPPVRQPSPPPLEHQLTPTPFTTSPESYNDANNYIIPDLLSDFVGSGRNIEEEYYKKDKFHLKICSKYLSKKGCNTKYCYRFHVCQFWIKGGCKKSECPFDHDFYSEDNRYLLSAVLVRRFDESDLIEKLRRNMYSGKHLSKDDDSYYICMDFILGQCKGRDNCTGIHERSPFSWEICIQGKWKSFPKGIQEKIEITFSDPKNDSYMLEPQSLESDRRQKNNFLSNYEGAVIDFEDMSMKTKNSSVLKVRRLSTPSDLIFFKSVATRWLWYWQEKNDHHWNFFNQGRVDDFLILAFSDYIELQFIKKNKEVVYGNESCKYHIQFENMSLIKFLNSESELCDSYKLRRRPMYVSDKKQKKEETFTSLWSNSNTNERFTRQVVCHGTSERYFVQQMIHKSLSGAFVEEIERVENPHLWQFYQLNKEKRKRLYSNDLNEQYLFHGTSQDVLDKICADNLDWRLYGSNVGNVYGRGTYFARDAELAKKYARPDSDDRRYIFVALVLVGNITVGNSKMTLPPIDPVTNRRYDSTVNNAENPEIFVKYNLDDYYPAYLVKVAPYKKYF